MADAPLTPTKSLCPQTEDEIVRTTDLGTWRYFMDEPGMGIVICDDSGRVLEANETGTQLTSGRSVDEFVGRFIEDVYGAEFVEGVIENMAAVHRSGKRGINRQIWGGKQLLVTHHSLGKGPTGNQMLYLIRHVWGPLEVIEENMEIFHKLDFNFVDFGELDVLTNRELEVLAHIGDGKSLADIAALLNRSRKTIDSHRSAIGRKMKVHTRAELAKKAMAAGLRVSDIKNRRIQSVQSVQY